MKGSSEVVLKTHLDQLDAEKRGKLFSFLSQEERAVLDQLPESDSTFAPAFESQEQKVRQIHYSWFLSIIKDFPEDEQLFFLAALEPISGQSLQSALAMKSPTYHPTSFAQNFICAFLYRKLCDNRIVLPSTYLPSSKMKALLALSKNECVALIQKLSLYDLAIELKQIVVTKALKKIYNLLTEEERLFLKKIPSEQESFQWPRIGLEKWDQTKEHFNTLVHRRGLYRLSIALIKEAPDLIWHLAHHLDIGRGSILLKGPEQQVPERIIQSTQAHILEILQR